MHQHPVAPPPGQKMRAPASAPVAASAAASRSSQAPARSGKNAKPDASAQPGLSQNLYKGS
jgi:hypothetical protein